MQLAYSTNAFTLTDLYTAIQQISDIGFTGVEILCDEPHLFPATINDNEISRITKLLDSTHLKVSNLNANTATGYFNPRPMENTFEPSLSNADPEFRSWRQKYTINTLQIAGDIGAACISITSGMPTPGIEPEKSLDYFIESLKILCEIAEKKQIKIGIEYEPGLLVERATEVHDVIERVGSDMLGVNFDIGHSYLVNENPTETVALLSGRIWNVHVEDIKNLKHYHLVPGLGDLPFSQYFQALNEINYNNFLTVELYTYIHSPVEAGVQSLDFLIKSLQTLD